MYHSESGNKSYDLPRHPECQQIAGRIQAFNDTSYQVHCIQEGVAWPEAETEDGEFGR